MPRNCSWFCFLTCEQRSIFCCKGMFICIEISCSTFFHLFSYFSLIVFCDLRFFGDVILSISIRESSSFKHSLSICYVIVGHSRLIRSIFSPNTIELTLFFFSGLTLMRLCSGVFILSIFNDDESRELSLMLTELSLLLYSDIFLKRSLSILIFFVIYSVIYSVSC